MSQNISWGVIPQVVGSDVKYNNPVVGNPVPYDTPHLFYAVSWKRNNIYIRQLLILIKIFNLRMTCNQNMFSHDVDKLSTKKYMKKLENNFKKALKNIQ